MVVSQARDNRGRETVTEAEDSDEREKREERSEVRGREPQHMVRHMMYGDQ